jgi:hypothetical protein
LAALLQEPFAALGSARPEFDSSLATHAIIGMLTDYLQQGRRPTRADLEHSVEFCLATVSSG